MFLAPLLVLQCIIINVEDKLPVVAAVQSRNQNMTKTRNRKTHKDSVFLTMSLNL